MAHGEASRERVIRVSPRGRDSVTPNSHSQAVDETFNLGGMLAERDDLSEAEAAYRRSDPDGAVNLAGLLAQRADLAGAGATFRHADDRGTAAALGVGRDSAAAWRPRRRRTRIGAPTTVVTGAFRLGGLLAEHSDLAAAEDAYRRAADRGDTRPPRPFAP